MLLSLFSGCGGLDLGFECEGYLTGLAYDKRPHSTRSWNRNRPRNQVGRVADISTLSVQDMDAHHGKRFEPSGVIGGPPCQSFTNANSRKRDDDPRAELLPRFFQVALDLHARSPLDFVVMENVPEVASPRYSEVLNRQISTLEDAGFLCSQAVLNAHDFGVPQNRKRLFVVALHKDVFGGRRWIAPTPSDNSRDVKSAIFDLPDPIYFQRGLSASEIPHHPNHWCMTPKSAKFGSSRLVPGKSIGRSFKMLHWDRPSFTVSYGNREVHVHPNGKRRLSVYEAMLLQGFPNSFVLEGNLSEQITQISEAVPPPLARAIAHTIQIMRGSEAPRLHNRCLTDVRGCPE